MSSENCQDIGRYHAYIDMEHTAGNWMIGYGVDYQHSADKSRQTYFFPAQPGFDNALREDVASAYAGTQTSFEWGLSFNASVKAEYFHNNYRHNWNVVPQFGDHVLQDSCEHISTQLHIQPCLSIILGAAWRHGLYQ